MLENIDDLSLIMTMEQGKPLAEAVGTIQPYQLKYGPGAVRTMSGYGMLGRIEPEQVKSFSRWVQRAGMNGRGDEVIDLAKTNLLPR